MISNGKKTKWRNNPVLNAKDVAEYFISIVDTDSQDFLTNLKVQKLLYYAQGFSLAIFRGPMFPEKIYAWQYGPVVKEVYKAYEQFGASAIPLPLKFTLKKYDTETRELLDEVFDVYGQFSAARLVDMTHSEPPWKKTKINTEISTKLMQDYFSKQIN